MRSIDAGLVIGASLLRPALTLNPLPAPVAAGLPSMGGIARQLGPAARTQLGCEPLRPESGHGHDGLLSRSIRGLLGFDPSEGGRRAAWDAVGSPEQPPLPAPARQCCVSGVPSVPTCPTRTGTAGHRACPMSHTLRGGTVGHLSWDALWVIPRTPAPRREPLACRP